MRNTIKTIEICDQLRRACLEMAGGFERMTQAEEITPDTWGEAVNALSETLAVARVNWAELTAETAMPANEYGFHFFAITGEEIAGASIQAETDEQAEDELREMAGLDPLLNVGAAVRVRLVHKASGRTWEIPLE